MIWSHYQSTVLWDVYRMPPDTQGAHWISHLWPPLELIALRHVDCYLLMIQITIRICEIWEGSYLREEWSTLSQSFKIFRSS